MKKYKIAVIILGILVILEGIFIIRLWISRPRKIPPPAVVIKGRIAVVLDDWGYNLNNLQLLTQIKYPLTVSLLPKLSYSQVIAKELRSRGYEVILHLPMEPHEKFRLEQNTIMTSMDSQSIISILSKDLESIPGLSGVSNHMGSKATEDARTMEIVFKELKKKNIYFLDSLVSPKSVCKEVAKKLNFGFAKRDVFLDNQEDREYIRGQLDKLKAKAAFYGRAVGIGHDRRVTLEVLKEELPKLVKEGYKLVFVSELIK